ncbi:low molecular weight protein arginine phosphatase [Shouchella shacheensis]|uniref:low molecular weight protein arginine phosphatase n=1 Tax=Shouchella shacheensis TaxID=1649580 RepID=UPI0007403178|nr:low molecular weight protein arginine phosphatase [Shouchella shacheensis]
MKQRILFVCTGNTCRSPLAEYFLRKQDKAGHFEVASAGIVAQEGSPISSGSASVLEEACIEHDHRARPVSDKLVNWADIILTMSESHKRVLQKDYSNQEEKVFTLKEYVQVDGSTDIADPFGGDERAYAQTAKEIDHQLKRLIKGDHL